MRRIVLTLALLSLAFAPAPFPRIVRPARESEQTKQDRLVRECQRRLDDLGVKWRLERNSVIFTVHSPIGSSVISGDVPVHDGDVASTLRRVVARAEELLGHRPRLKP
jgi:hypothetical protein